MTDLIERLRALGRGPCIFWEAADAIEALQAENERLKSSLFTANRNNIRLVTAHLEQEEKTLAERDALQAKLDAIGKGEPVGYVGAGYLTLGEGAYQSMRRTFTRFPCTQHPRRWHR